MHPLTNQALKILYLSSDKYPPFRVDVAVLFGNKLVSRGHKIDWILQSDSDLSESKIVSIDGGVVLVGNTDNCPTRAGKIRKVLKDIRNDFNVFHQSKKQKYDFIQVKDKFIAALFAIRAAKISKTRFIYWLSYPFPEAYIHRYKEGTSRYPLLDYVRGHLFKWLLYKYIMIKADHIFVQSEQMKRDIINEGISEHKLTAVPMGVEMSKVPYSSNDLTLENTSPTVVYLGTLNRVRRIDFLVRAFAQTKNLVPNAILYFVGSGEYKSDLDFLKKEVDRLQLNDSVIFTGFLPMEQAWEYVGRANVCVSPFYPTATLNSTSPTKLIEYMAMGKAVVANDHPEQSLVIAESGAGICVPYNENAFGNAIADLLNDNDMAKTMGEKGRLYAIQNRSYDIIADNLEASYKSILSSPDYHHN